MCTHHSLIYRIELDVTTLNVAASRRPVIIAVEGASGGTSTFRGMQVMTIKMWIISN